jgi:hypothetical protein
MGCIAILRASAKIARVPFGTLSMDREALLETLPNTAAFNAMAPYQRKTITEDFIEAILDAIDAEEREPDDWETGDVAAAIGLIACRWYNAGLAAAERALTPPHQRSPLAAIAPAGGHAMQRLRDGLAHVRGMPAPAVF